MLDFKNYNNIMTYAVLCWEVLEGTQKINYIYY